MTRVLVTGAMGFIGKELCTRLEERGYEVWCTDQPLQQWYQTKERLLYGDVSNLDSCRRQIREAMPEIIVHLASVTSTDKIMYDEPERVIDVTFKGTMNVSLAWSAWAKETKTHPRQFVFASSAEVYGAADNPPFTEETEPRPNNIYAVSKWAGEKHLRYWSQDTGIPVTIMRNFNTYGNLGYQRTFVDVCVKDMLQKHAVRLGHPDMVRDWEFRDDHVNAYLTVVNNPKAYNETFNFCVGQPYTIRDTADIIAAETRFKGEILTGGLVHSRPNDAPILHGSYGKAKRILNWKPEYDFTHGIRKYVEEMRPRI